jgi:tetratricopeptide (TPR) repeat protein
MERVAAGAVDSVADLLSLHFFEGGDPERAWRYARLAGSKAQASYANDDAAALYRRALEAGRRLGEIPSDELLATWTALGDVQEQAGLLDAALDAYRRATGLAKGDDERRAQLLLRRARVRERSGAYVAALQELRAAERGVRELTTQEADRVRVSAATLRAIVHEGQEQPRRALAAAREAAEAAKRLGDLRELANAYNVIDWAHVVLGQMEQAVHQPRIIQIYHELGEPHREAAALGNHGAVQYWGGRWDEALDCYQRANDAYAATGDVVNAAVQQANIAELLINRGELAAAGPMAEQAAQTHRAVGFVDGALFDEVQVGRLRLAQGDHEGAAAILAAARDEASAMGLHATALDATIPLAECDVRLGGVDPLDALAAAEQAAGEEAAVLEAAIALARARVLARRGDQAGARHHRTAGIEAARRLGVQYELGLLLVLDGSAEDQEEGRALLGALGVPLPQVNA